MLPPLVYKDEREELRYRLNDLYEAVGNSRYTKKAGNEALLLLHNEVGALAAAIIKNKSGEDMRIIMTRIVTFLKYVCYEFLLEKSLFECYEAAYEVIKDRKGKTTPEGNFIKEGD